MTRQLHSLPMPLVIVLIGAPLAFAETHAVFKSGEMEEQAAKTRGSLPLHSGAGYAVQLETIGNGRRRASGEPVDQMLWIRRGVGRLSLGSPPRQSDIAAGDLVRIPRGTAYAIQALSGRRLELIAVRLQPLGAGGAAPAGIRPAHGEMGDVVKKAEIDTTIARTQANAPLHSQDNFTVNYVLFKGRVGPWESHAGCVDIYLVQAGAGVIQLGGSIDNAKEDSPGEPRGTGMTGSQESAVGAGDLVVIPRNLAHHMNPKSLPLAYVLIKVWSK
jgi:mannose-6-phosphate isomerase-like protein (cupin superfamily)